MIQQTNEVSSSKVFFSLVGTVVLGVFAFAGILHANNLEQIYIYKEDHRLSAAKDALFKNECQAPRREQERLTAKIEEQTGAAAFRMKTIYLDGSKAHELYSAGEKIVQGEKYVEQKCQDALKHAGELKRGSSTDFIVANFFGSR